MNITMIGPGNMGCAIAIRALAGGHSDIERITSTKNLVKHKRKK